jgi:regulator of sigma D
MDKKRSFIFYPMSFLAAVHNLRKTQIADFILSLCEINLYGSTKISISDSEIKSRMKFLQDDIDTLNANYYKIKESRQKSGSKGGSKTQAKAKQTTSKVEAKVSDASEFCLKQNQANACDNDNVNVKEKFKNKFLVVGKGEAVDNSKSEAEKSDAEDGGEPCRK